TSLLDHQRESGRMPVLQYGKQRGIAVGHPGLHLRALGQAHGSEHGEYPGAACAQVVQIVAELALYPAAVGSMDSYITQAHGHDTALLQSLENKKPGQELHLAGPVAPGTRPGSRCG